MIRAERALGQTPFELSAENELNVERQRFANKWLFPWYQMNMEGRSFTVEDFRGGHISYGGNQFEGQPQINFWQAIERYLKGKVHEYFRRWENETRSYPAASRAASLEGLSGILGRFVASVVQNAIDTDQALRGRGYPPKDLPRHSSGAHAGANAEIMRLKAAYQALIPVEQITEAGASPSRIWQRLWTAIGLKPGMFGITVDLKELFRGKK